MAHAIHIFPPLRPASGSNGSEAIFPHSKTFGTAPGVRTMIFDVQFLSHELHISHSFHQIRICCQAIASNSKNALRMNTLAPLCPPCLPLNFIEAVRAKVSLDSRKNVFRSFCSLVSVLPERSKYSETRRERDIAIIIRFNARLLCACSAACIHCFSFNKSKERRRSEKWTMWLHNSYGNFSLTSLHFIFFRSSLHFTSTHDFPFRSVPPMIFTFVLISLFLFLSHFLFLFHFRFRSAFSFKNWISDREYCREEGNCWTHSIPEIKKKNRQFLWLIVKCLLMYLCFCFLYC